MIIGGLQKFSTLDYPDSLSAIVFTQGCNFRCPFCYNPMLVCPQKGSDKKYFSLSSGEEDKKVHSQIIEDDFFVFLKSRIGKLDSVVVTGGEPTLHRDLPEFIQKIKKMGFKVKLDTNGTNPEMLKRLLEEKLVDYVAMDIKASFKKYKQLAGVEVSWQKIEKSVIIIKSSGILHEFRTTVIPGLLYLEDIKIIGEVIQGAKKWFLQKFKGNIDLIDNSLQKAIPYTSAEMEEMRQIGEQFANECRVR